MSGKLLLIAVIQVLTILVGLVRAKGLALLLGPADFGVVSTIDQVVLTVMTVGALAFPFTALKFMSRAHSEGEAAFRRSGAGFLRLMLALAVVSTLMASLVLAWNPAAFGKELVAHHGALEVALLGVPSLMLLILFVNAFAAAARPVSAATTNLAAISAMAVASLIGAWWRGVGGLYALTVPAAVGVSVVGLMVLHRVLHIPIAARNTGIIGVLRSDPAIVSVSFCMYATFAGTSIMMLLARTIVLAELGPADVGHMQAAFSIALTVGAVLYPLTNLYLNPLVNRRGAMEEKSHAVDAFVSRMLILLLLGALPALLFPALLLRVLFSTEFAPVASVLWGFVLWQCVFQIAHVYQQLLIGVDDVLYAAIALIGGCVVAIVAMPPLVDRFALGGVGAALTAGMATWGVAVALRVRLKHRGRISRRVLARVASVILIVSSTGYFFAGREESSPNAFALRVVAAAIAVLICWLLLERHERHPRRWIAALRPGAQP